MKLERNKTMNKHEKLLQEKFSHATDDLIYNSGGNVMWSLFRFESGDVTIYYHDTDGFYILNGSEARWYSLAEIADNWDPVKREILF